MATGSVTLDLDGIARDAAAIGWTVEPHGRRKPSLGLARETRRGEVSVLIWPDGEVECWHEEFDGVRTAMPWAVVGPLYRIIEQHKTEG